MVEVIGGPDNRHANASELLLWLLLLLLLLRLLVPLPLLSPVVREGRRVAVAPSSTWNVTPRVDEAAQL